MVPGPPNLLLLCRYRSVGRNPFINYASVLPIAWNRLLESKFENDNLVLPLSSNLQWMMLLSLISVPNHIYNSTTALIHFVKYIRFRTLFVLFFFILLVCWFCFCHVIFKFLLQGNHLFSFRCFCYYFWFSARQKSSSTKSHTAHAFFFCWFAFAFKCFFFLYEFASRLFRILYGILKRSEHNQ